MFFDVFEPTWTTICFLTCLKFFGGWSQLLHPTCWKPVYFWRFWPTILKNHCSFDAFEPTCKKNTGFVYVFEVFRQLVTVVATKMLCTYSIIVFTIHGVTMRGHWAAILHRILVRMFLDGPRVMFEPTLGKKNSNFRNIWKTNRKKHMFNHFPFLRIGVAVRDREVIGPSFCTEFRSVYFWMGADGSWSSIWTTNCEDSSTTGK